MITDWINFVASAAFNACVVIFLFEGTRRMGTYGIHRIEVLMTAFGVVFCLLYSGISYWKYGLLNDMIPALSKNIIANELPEDWGKQLAPENREKSSLTLAQIVFINSGKFHSYFDKSGDRNRYSPTEEDIKNRDYAVVTKARLEDAMRMNLAEAFSWLIWGVIAAVFGFGVGRYKPTLPANPTVETDARKGSSRGSP